MAERGLVVASRPGAPGSASAAGCTCSATASGADRRRPRPPVDRDSVLADGREARDARVRASYDAVAERYADQLVDELIDGQPFERWLLDRVAAHADGGPVVEVGCGPGHVTAYLAEAGADATGIDLSPGMVEAGAARGSRTAPTRSATCAG